MPEKDEWVGHESKPALVPLEMEGLQQPPLRFWAQLLQKPQHNNPNGQPPIAIQRRMIVQTEIEGTHAVVAAASPSIITHQLHPQSPTHHHAVAQMPPEQKLSLAVPVEPPATRVVCEQPPHRISQEQSQHEDPPVNKRRRLSLPPNVVRCAFTSGAQRYGVKLKVSGRQYRIGCRYTDPESAGKVAKAAKHVLALDDHGDFYFRPLSGAIRAMTCEVYTTRQTKQQRTIPVSMVLEQFVQFANSKNGKNSEGRRALKGTLARPFDPEAARNPSYGEQADRSHANNGGHNVEPQQESFFYVEMLKMALADPRHFAESDRERLMLLYQSCIDDRRMLVHELHMIEAALRKVFHRTAPSMPAQTASVAMLCVQTLVNVTSALLNCEEIPNPSPQNNTQ